LKKWDVFSCPPRSLLLQTNRVFVVLAVFGILGGISDWLFRRLSALLLARYLDVAARA
jgi:hypothetical protein